MFVRPAPRAYVSPELSFLRVDNAHPDIAVVFGRGLFNRPIEDVADFDRSIVAGAKQVQSSDPRERTYFMHRPSPAIDEETLDHIQRGRAQLLEYAQSETLGDRGVDSIEYGVCSGAFNPRSAAFGE